MTHKLAPGLIAYGVNEAAVRLAAIHGKPISARHFSLLAQKTGIYHTIPQLFAAHGAKLVTSDTRTRYWTEDDLQALARSRGVGRDRAGKSNK